ncbi:FAD-dependent oxidoreductase [Nocardiopsis coralliicola]
MAATCAVVGGGPAGMVLGLLLARCGIETTVVEKHADFLRDFRGDTVHPSTMALLDELGLGERFAELPQSRLERATASVGGRSITPVDFTLLRTAHPYVAMVPQWDLLNLLAESGAEEPAFTLRMRTEAVGLLREHGRVAGVRLRGPGGEEELRAEVTVACDGRHSLLRRVAGLRPREFPVGFDAWWFRVPVRTGIPPTLMPRLGRRRIMVGIPRQGYLQVAYLGPKGTDGRLRARGVQALRADVAELMPELSGEVAQIASMDDVKHLDVRVDRLRRWHLPGLLCIGDAAHAMSPLGGVGINLAVQDAVAAARLLAGPLQAGRVAPKELARVRRRRLVPTVAVQALQRFLHRRVLDPALRGEAMSIPGAAVRILSAAPRLAVVPAYLIGFGVLPERPPAAARRSPAPRPADRANGDAAAGPG